MQLLTSDGRITDPYRNFIAESRYARWDDNQKRRETWTETVDRYISFITKHLGDKANLEDISEAREAILNHEVMPSMRAMMTAGAALDRNHIAAYNCAFLPVDDLRAFDEALYILSCGTGVGYSVEQQFISKLPTLSETFESTSSVIKVADSKEGWAKSYRELLALVWVGQIPKWDVSEVRPRGARLKTFGGRASGPGPLVELFEFTINIATKAAGRKINPLEAHDLMCKIGDVIVSGGVRRSALISLSDLNDPQMARAKSGAWWENEPQRALANNSAVYESKPSMDQFMTEWKSLYDSKSGERGIVNRQAMRRQASLNGRRDEKKVIGTNPCSEIILRSYQFCNLSEIVVRPTDTLKDLTRKARLATLIGTWQASLTNFKYIRRIWQTNTEEERLLGVSLTGTFGHQVLKTNDEKLVKWLDTLKNVAIQTNAEEASRIGIAQAAAITCVKPSGTVSQLTGVSSGLHPWHNDYYIRTVRGSNDDPLTQFLIMQGVPSEPDLMKPDRTTVFSFPTKAPTGALTRNDLTAIEHLELWLTYQRSWCEHKPSVTISVRTDEWLEVGAWVYKHFNEMSGVSFLPYSEHSYKQAPYQDITAEVYKERLSQFPKKIAWDYLSSYETEDATTGSQELACTSGACDIVTIGDE